MAEGNTLSAEELRNIKVEAQELKLTLETLTSNLDKAAQAYAKSTGDSAAGFKESLTSSKNLLKDLTSVSKETLKDRKNLERFENKIKAARKEQLRVDTKITVLSARLATATADQRQKLEEVIELLYEQRSELGEAVNLAGKLTSDRDWETCT